jgi:hypothetical protein
MSPNLARLRSRLALEEWRRRRRIDRLRAHANPDREVTQASDGLSLPLETWRRGNQIDRLRARATSDWAAYPSQGPITRVWRRIADAVDARIVVALLACLAVAGVGVAGYLVGEANAVGADEATEVRESAFQDAFAAARQDAIAQGEARGRKAGAQAGRRAAEKAGARAGAQRGAAAAAREQEALAAAAAERAAEAAAERRAQQEAPADEASGPTSPEPEPAAPEPVAPAPAPQPPPEPCFDALGFPC